MNKASAASSILCLVGAGARRGAAPIARASVWVCFTGTPGGSEGSRASQPIQLNVRLNATGPQRGCQSPTTWSPRAVWLYSRCNVPDRSMPTIAIKRRHKLEPKKAKAAAQKVIKDLSARYQLACSWDGDQVKFERPGVSGRMHLGRSEIVLGVQLSFLMSTLKCAIERAIKEEFDRLCGA